jgi:hypothetical protein
MLLKTKIKINMELGNNKAKGYEGKDIQKPPLTESQRLREIAEKQWKELGKLGSVFGPALNAANTFDQSNQTVGHKIDINNNEVSVNGEKISHEDAKKYGVHMGNHVGDINSVSIGGTFEGVINTGNNGTIDDIKVPDFVGEHNYNSDDYQLDDGSFVVPSFGQKPKVDYSDRSIKINGNVVGGNIVMGNVGGDVIYNSKPESEPYSLKRDQIIQDDLGPLKKESKPEYIPEPTEDPWESNTSELPISPKEKALDELPELNYEVIKDGPKQFNSMDDVFEQMVKNWEKQYGVEPIPKLEPDSSNMEEIIDVINRNWETKYANLLDKKANQEPPQKEIKEVVRKRDKIKNVLKNVGNKIKEWYDKFDIKIDDDIDFESANSPSFYVETDTRTPEQKLSDSVNTINDNQRSNKYVQNGESTFGSVTPEMKARRQKIDEIKSQRIENQKAETPKTDRETYIAPQSQIDYVNQQDQITIPTNKTETAEIVNDGSEIMDVNDQNEFIQARMDSVDKLMTVEELENEIANIENGTITIPDAIADESDYEGTDEEIDAKLLKNQEYNDARDLNMQKLYEIVNVLKLKKDIVKDLNEDQKADVMDYKSYAFTVYDKDGSKWAKLNNDPDNILNVETTEDGKLKVKEPNGKEYVITDYENKSKVQKAEVFAKRLNQEMEQVKISFQNRIDNLK